LVIDMRDRQHDPQLIAQLEQQTEQSHGIRPARNGRGYAISRPQRIALPDCLPQTLC